MKTFTDDEMNEVVSTATSYSLVILKPGPNAGNNEAPALIWAHGRRNLGLRHAGILAAAFTVLDGSEVWGVRAFTETVDDTTAIMNDDPGVRGGIFTFEVHACRGFAGDRPP
jgi:hypothetical protein